MREESYLAAESRRAGKRAFCFYADPEGPQMKASGPGVSSQPQGPD